MLNYSKKVRKATTLKQQSQILFGINIDSIVRQKSSFLSVFLESFDKLTDTKSWIRKKKFIKACTSQHTHSIDCGKMKDALKKNSLILLP